MENKLTTDVYGNQGYRALGRVPELPLRIKASMIDASLVFILMIIMSVILERFNSSGSLINITLYGMVFLYEPLLTCINQTIGQKIMGLRVVNFSTYKNNSTKHTLNFFASLIRYIVKLLLGWLSLITIHSSENGRAIHDHISSSIMIQE